MSEGFRPKSLLVSEPSSSEGFPTSKDAPNEDEWADGNMAGETFLTLQVLSEQELARRLGWLCLDCLKRHSPDECCEQELGDAT